MLMAEYDMMPVTLVIVHQTQLGYISGCISAASEAILQVYFKGAGTACEAHASSAGFKFLPATGESKLLMVSLQHCSPL